jgi:hypothetical protein
MIEEPFHGRRTQPVAVAEQFDSRVVLPAA